MNIAEGVDDRVMLRLGGRELLIAEQYEIKMGLLVQPCIFTLTVGSPAVAGRLLDRFPVGTEFDLSVGGRVQFTGVVDAANLSGGKGTRVTLRGRDKMAPLLDTEVRSEEGFGELSVQEIAELVLERSLFGRSWDLVYGDDAGRKMRSGGGGKAGGGPSAKVGMLTGLVKGGQRANVSQVIAETVKALGGEFGGATPDQAIEKVKATAAKPAAPKVQAKLGDSLFMKLAQPEFTRKGIFMIASAAGPYALIKPAAKQAPEYRIVRRPAESGRPGIGKVIDGSLQIDTTNRYSLYEVHGRQGGGSKARKRIVARYVDREMFDLGFFKVRCLEDDKSSNVGDCEQRARRECADARRAGWVLTYEMAGHTTESIDGAARRTWTWDTTVDVVDEVLGVTGTFYIESVQFKRGPQTTTTLRLMRPEDVLFGEEGDGERIGTLAASPPTKTAGLLTRTVNECREIINGAYGLNI